jgi:hypothetical protein
MICLRTGVFRDHGTGFAGTASGTRENNSHWRCEFSHSVTQWYGKPI